MTPTPLGVKITHPGILRGRRNTVLQTFFDFPNFDYGLDAGRPVFSLSFDALAKRLEASGVKPSRGVAIEIMFQQA